MPGLRGPSDYSQEPPRHPSLKVNSKVFNSEINCLISEICIKHFFLFMFLVQEPFNAEPHRAALLSYITPIDFFYKRNHGPIPVVDDIERSSFVGFKQITDIAKWFIGGCPSTMSLQPYRRQVLLCCSELKIVQCAGNRRTAMSKTRKVKGVGWDVSAIGNVEPSTESNESYCGTVGGEQRNCRRRVAETVAELSTKKEKRMGLGRGRKQGGRRKERQRRKRRKKEEEEAVEELEEEEVQTMKEKEKGSGGGGEEKKPRQRRRGFVGKKGFFSLRREKKLRCSVSSPHAGRRNEAMSLWGEETR
ncbi:hypothetical protein GW17_00027811 [Ensete ventricosum]|nr:hypothetical protein GW17_00027811 [Ensete ventricosum]